MKVYNLSCKITLISLFITIIEWWAGFYNIITTIVIIISLYIILTKYLNNCQPLSNGYADYC